MNKIKGVFTSLFGSIPINPSALASGNPMVAYLRTFARQQRLADLFYIFYAGCIFNAAIVIAFALFSEFNIVEADPFVRKVIYAALLGLLLMLLACSIFIFFRYRKRTESHFKEICVLLEEDMMKYYKVINRENKPESPFEYVKDGTPFSAEYAGLNCIGCGARLEENLDLSACPYCNAKIKPDKIIYN